MLPHDPAHTFKWNYSTHIERGLAQCTDPKCALIDTEVKYEDCVNYISPAQITETERKRKEKRAREHAKKVAATIEWLKQNKKSS